MSGTDALKGFDYQISYVLYKLVELIAKGINDIDHIKFESVNEEEEDLNLIYKDGTVEFIQIKKRNEGRMWTPTDLKELFRHYMRNFNCNTRYSFVTNGSANEDVKKFRSYLSGKKMDLSQKEINRFIPEGCSEDLFKQMSRSISINTLVMVSNNEEDLTETVKRETISLLTGASFYLNNNVEIIYKELWKYVFDISKRSLEIKYTEIINMFKNFGALKIDSNEWLKFPIINDFKGRNNECKEIMSLIENHNKIVLCGISGIGKSYIMSNVAQKLTQDGVDVCWLSLRANMTFDKMLNIFGAFFENQIKINDFYKQLKNNEIGNQIQMLNNVFRNNKCIIFIDSFEIAENNVRYLLCELLKNMKNTDLARIVLSTTDSTELYNQIDLAIKNLCEYTINEFMDEDLKDFYSELQLPKEDYKMIFEAVGGFPVANSLVKEYLYKNPLSNLNLAELLRLTSEEKNRWLFNKIYIHLSDEEQELLSYLSTLGYGFSDYEISIIEKGMQSKLKYTFVSLTNKKLVLFDGDVYFLHGVMKKLAYEMLADEKKNNLHRLFVSTYEKRLLNHTSSKKPDDEFLSSKWGYHVTRLFELEELEDEGLNIIMSLTTQQRFDLWGIWWCAFPFEFDDINKKITVDRANYLENMMLIKQKGKYFTLNSEKVTIKMLYLIEYMVKKEFNTIAMGYIPIFKPNLAFDNQKRTACEWEHCIEFMPLEGDRTENSCIIFGHNCPGGKIKVAQCKPLRNKLMHKLGYK